MKRHHLSLFGVPTLLLLTMGAAAQNQPASQPDDDPAVLRQKFQASMMQVMENVRNSGQDVGAFWQDIGTRMANGSLTQEELTQELVDKNFLDQKTVDDLRATGQRVTFSMLKKNLGCTDAEWEVLLPKIKDVLAAQASMGQPTQGGFGLSNLSDGSPQVSHDVRTANLKLRMMLRDKGASTDDLKQRMQDIRDAKKAAADNLAAAQKALIELLTARQEAFLATIGLLQ